MNTCGAGSPKPGSPEGPGTFTPRTAYPPDVLQANAVKLYATRMTMREVGARLGVVQFRPRILAVQRNML